MTTRTSNVGLFNTGDVLTEAHLDSLPAGWLGYVEKTTDTTGVTSVQTMITLTVSLNANRRVKIIGYVPAWSSTVSGDRAQFTLMEGATQLTFSRSTTQVGGGVATEAAVTLMSVETPSSGSHTYSLQVARNSGSGTLIASGDVTGPSFLMLEDIGPA